MRRSTSRSLQKPKAAGLTNLKGHRVVGGMRASLYNAMPEAGVDALDRLHGRFRKAARVSAMASFKIRTLNSIAVAGLDRLPRDRYEVASEIGRPDAILLRSFKMHDLDAARLACSRSGGRARAPTTFRSRS